METKRKKKRWSQIATTSKSSNIRQIYLMHLPNMVLLCSLHRGLSQNYGLKAVDSGLSPEPIMRAFVRLREMIATNKELAKRLDEIEKKYDAQFKVVFDAIRQLMTPPEPKEKKIGFHVRERRIRYRTSS